MIWDVFTGLKTCAIPLSNAWPLSLGVSKSGRNVAVGGLDNAVTVYKVDTIEDSMQATYDTFGNDYSINNDISLEGSPSGGSGENSSSQVGSGRKKLGSLFQMSAGKGGGASGENYQMSSVGGNSGYTVFKGHSGYISSIEFLTEEKLLSASGDRAVFMWDLNKGMKVNEFVDRNLGDVTSTCLHPTNPNIFVSSAVRTVKVWDVRLKSSLQSFFSQSGDVNVVRMFPDGNAIATGANDCRIYDLRSDCEVALFENPNFPSSNNNNYGYNQSRPPVTPTFLQYNTIDSMSTSLLQHNDYQRETEYHSVCELSFSPSGRLLFSAYEDGSWGAWDVLKGQYLGNLPKTGARDIKDSKTATTFPLKNANMNVSGSSRNSQSLKGQITSIQISKDGSRIYTSNWDSMIRGYVAQ